MTPSPGPLLVEFLDPPPGLRRSLSCSDVLASRPLGNPSFQGFRPLEDTAFPPAWLLPPPTRFSATAENRFNTQ